MLVLGMLMVWAASPAKSGSIRIHWRELHPGLYFDRIYDPLYCRKGSRYTAAVRIDPSLYRFEAFHISELSGSKPMNAGEWQERLHAPVVFNAGQYYESLRHMGLLVKKGTNLGTRLIKKWEALFVEVPSPSSGGAARILDLRYQKGDLSGRSYGFAVQSLMLIDHRGAKRVRRSDRVANRTVLASLKDGGVAVFCSEGGYTLSGMADFIRSLDLNVYNAMALDGGRQAQLAVQTPTFRYDTYGCWSAQPLLKNVAIPLRVGIPAVIAVFPRKR